jgi:hypothetical protein
MPYIGNNHIVGDHVNNFKVLDDISSYTATFDATSASVVSVSDDTIRIPNHRFIQGQRVLYSDNGGNAIAGLADLTPYFIVFDTNNTIKLATSLINATNNNFVNLTGVASSGTTHTLNASFDGVNTKFKITHSDGKSARFINPSQLNIAINNVIQRPNMNDASFVEGFAVEHKEKIVFKSAPISSDTFWGNLIGESIETFDISDLKIDNYTGDGSTASFTISRRSPNSQSLMITLDGVLQHPTDNTTTRSYSLVGDNVVEFTSPPANGVEIQIRHLGFAGATTSNVSGFYGRTGNVTLTSSDNVTVGVLTASQITGSIVAGAGSSNISAGIITAVTGEFTNVTIGGTLVYEDVKNVDAIGIVTARSGIKVGSGVTIEPNGQATFTGIVTFGSNSTTIGDNVINVGTALTLGHTQGVQFHTQNLHADGFEINNINASGIITASSIVASTLSANIPSGIGTALSTDDNSPLSKIFYNDAVLSIGSTTTINHPASADAAYTRFSDIRVDGDADLIVSDGDDFVPDVFGLNEFGTLGGGSGGRMRVDRITDAAGTGAVTIENGLVVAGVTTFAGSGFSVAEEIYHDGDDNTKIKFPAADNISFETNGGERVRINHYGRVMVGTTTEGHGSANDLTIATTGEALGNTGITIRSSTNGNGNIFFSDGTSGGDEYRGKVTYEHSNDAIVISTATQERLRITSLGQATFQPESDITEAIRIAPDVDASTQQEFGIGLAANVNHTHPAAKITFKEFDTSDSRGDLLFYTRGTNSDSAPTERLRIDSNGKLILGTEFVNGNNAPANISFYLSGARGTYGGLDTNAVIFDNQTAAVDAGGTLELAGYSGTAAVVKAAIRGGNEGSAATYAGYFAVFTRPASGVLTERLRIGSSGQFGLSGTNYGTAGQYLKSNGTSAAPTWGTARFSTYAFICELNGDTTDAGTLTANTWMTRDVTHEQADPDNIVTLDGSGNFTLQAGTYFIEWSAPAWRSDRHTSRLYDVNAGIAKGFGTLEFSQDSSGYAMTASRGFARFTISSSNTYRIQTKGNVTKSTDGLGLDPNNLGICLYTFAKIYKESE